MLIERKKDLSIYYWLKDLFAVEAPFVTIVDGFPETDLVIPTVSIEWGKIRLEPQQLGTREEQFIRIWYVDVFAKTKAQRDDFAYYILDALKNPIPVYDYDVGFPPTVVPPQIGYLVTYDKEAEPVKIIPELVDTLYYRSTVSFMADYANNV